MGQYLGTLMVYPDICLLTCHFRQPGLNDGNPRLAEFSSVKIYRLFFMRCGWFRNGSSLAVYVRKGNRLNKCLIGAGVVSHDC